MKKAVRSMILGLMLFSPSWVLADCIPRRDLMDKHVISYMAYNGTIRGCVVTPNFFTQQHKKGRGRLSRKFKIDICEGEPRTSPRTGKSFEICSAHSKPKAPPAE